MPYIYININKYSVLIDSIILYFYISIFLNLVLYKISYAL